MTEDGSVEPQAAGDPGPSRSTLEWRAWPVRERPRAGVLAALAIVAASVMVASIAGHPVFGLIAAAVLLGSLNPFFSPTTFRLDEEKIEVVRWPVRKVRSWSDVRSCFVDRQGVTLSPFVGKSFLEPYRAVRLFFAQNRAEVLAYLRAHVPEGVRFVELSKAAKSGSGSGAGPTGG